MTEIFYADRSGEDLDDTCGMAFWWNRLEGERGIVPAQEAIELQVGREVHEDLDWAARADISEGSLAEYLAVLTQFGLEDLRQDAKERLYRRMGWLVAYCLFLEPQVRARYKNVMVEAELPLDRRPLVVGTTPDRILEDERGNLIYREYKSTISASGKWMNYWKYAIQLHIGMKAAQEELGRKIQYAQIMGLMKGDERNGRLIHPYVWAWYSASKNAWTHEYNKARGGDWAVRPVWEYEGGIIEWVKRVGKDEAMAQFPHSEPVFLNERMLEDWVGRRTARHQKIEEVKEECRNSWESRVIHFEPRTSKCAPPFGPACPYRPLCWNAENQRDPLKTGDFVPRTPHHMFELTVME